MARANDPVTGLAGTQAMLADIDAALADGAERPLALALFDLEGFKEYNDDFGRACGDVLLGRLGRRIAERLAGAGSVYRLRGDEFAALLRDGSRIDEAAEALRESGEGFGIGCLYAAVELPAEAADARAALRLADQRLLSVRFGDADSRALDELRAAGRERSPGLSELARSIGARLGLAAPDLEVLEWAADLREVAGRLALPASIADGREIGGEDARRYGELLALAGERVLRARFGLHAVADVVRAIGERYDGSGRPDGLTAAEIPPAARVIPPCVTYLALTARGYAPDDAAAELGRFTGSRFDPSVVSAIAAEADEAQHGAWPLLQRVV